MLAFKLFCGLLAFFTKTNQNTSGIASSDVVSELQPQNQKGKSAVCSVRSGRFTINILSKTASWPVVVPFFKHKYFQIFVVWKETIFLSLYILYIYKCRVTPYSPGCPGILSSFICLGLPPGITHVYHHAYRFKSTRKEICLPDQAREQARDFRNGGWNPENNTKPKL